LKILALYFSRSLASGWLLVLAVTSAVFGLLFLVNELEHVTEGYTFYNAIIYVLLSLPQRILDLAPVGVLLGTLIVLSNMEKGTELTIIASAGIGTIKILKLMAIPLVIFMVSLWFVEEFVTARLHRIAEEFRVETYGESKRLFGESMWMRDGTRYVHLGGLDSEGFPRNIDIYNILDDGELIKSVHADKGEVIKNRRWKLGTVVVKERLEGVLTTRTVDEMEVDNLWTQNELPSLAFSSESMSPSVLFRYIDYLKQTGQKVEFYSLSFWNRVFLPLNCAAMMLLATPIGGRPGNARNSSMGRQLGIGALIGIFFYLGAQVVYAVGLIANIPPIVISLIPVLVTMAAAFFLLRRTQW